MLTSVVLTNVAVSFLGDVLLYSVTFPSCVALLGCSVHSAAARSNTILQCKHQKPVAWSSKAQQHKATCMRQQHKTVNQDRAAPGTQATYYPHHCGFTQLATVLIAPASQFRELEGPKMVEEGLRWLRLEDKRDLKRCMKKCGHGEHGGRELKPATGKSHYSTAMWSTLPHNGT